MKKFERFLFFFFIDRSAIKPNQLVQVNEFPVHLAAIFLVQYNTKLMKSYEV